MSSYAVINVQVNIQGASGTLTVTADSGSKFDVSAGVWQRVWTAPQAGDQATETISPDQMKFTETEFVYAVDNVWGLNHQFSIKMTTDTGTASAAVSSSGFKLATDPAVYYRPSQNDGSEVVGSVRPHGDKKRR
jgi:hypothetical protein